MPTMSASKTFADFSPGVSNRFPPNRLETRLATNMPASYLRDAINYDITSKGTTPRRQGYKKRMSAEVRDAWGDGGRDGYVVVDGVLNQVTGWPFVTTPLAEVGQARLSYSRAPDGSVYWTDGTRIERVSGTVSGQAVQPPPTTPQITVGAGALPQGRYMLAFTLIGAAGETAATWPVNVDVPEAGAVLLSGCEPGLQVYMTGPNGEVLTFVGVAGGSDFAVPTLVQDGRRCETVGLVPMPPGQILRHALGRMLVASGNTLYISEPFRYGLMNPSSGFLQFEAPISVVAPTPNGVYVCADHTFWMPELPPQELNAVLPFGAVPRSDTVVPASSDQPQRCAWMSPRGLVVASEGGEVALPQDAALNFSAAARASTLLRESDGERWLITTRGGVAPMISKARNAGT